MRYFFALGFLTIFLALTQSDPAQQTTGPQDTTPQNSAPQNSTPQNSTSKSSTPQNSPRKSPSVNDNSWIQAESVHLKNIKQLTKDFVRAGEAYFSPDGKDIIYQAEVKDSGNPFYQIFIQNLDSGKYRRISPGNGRTTCAYFTKDGKSVIFASSHEDPDTAKWQKQEYSKREEDKKNNRHRLFHSSGF